MSATNQTPNYGLPQYVADDKPTYLGDFNKAMLDIDTNMKTIDNKAISAESSANSAVATATTAGETAETAQTTATTAQTTANVAKTTADTAISNAETAQTTATTAQNNISNLETNIKNWSEPVNVAKNQTTGNLYLSYNKYLKLFTLFGACDFNNMVGGDNIIGKLPDQSLYPSEERVVYNAIATTNSTIINLRFRTNGDIVWVNGSGESELKSRANATINYNFWN